MKYVLDANVALKAFLVEESSDKARQLLDEFRHGVHEFLVPDTFPSEVANALTRAERRRAIPIGDAALHYGALMTAPPEIFPSVPMIARAINISSQTRTSIFDCLYLVLAEEHGCPFLTADRRMLNSLNSSSVLMLDQLR